MNISENLLNCSVTLEWTTPQGTTLRKTQYRCALLRIVRNEFRTMLLEVSSEKAITQKFELKALNVHKKFMNEGKATIKFQDAKCTIFISNAPPGSLMSFLKTMFVKMTKDNTPSKKKVSLRTQLLSNAPHTIEDISPVTIAELNKAKAKVTKSTETTPSPPIDRKRKHLEVRAMKAPAAKKLYSEPSISNEVLNAEQQNILEACLKGQNIFFTGSAGTGKSHLLRRIVALLPPDVTIITASTGVAACHIGGVTLHSFAGIGGGEATLERCYEMASKPVVAQAWRKCKHLVIDEISMVDAVYFDKIEAVARRIRGNDKPFGGIQLILCGDFFQLPPVTKFSKSANKSKTFCFQSSAWKQCINSIYELHQVHRQTDSEFIAILNCIRKGVVTPEIAETLRNTTKQKIEESGILATRLCSHTNDANILNESKLEKLSGEARTFTAQDSDVYLAKQLDQQLAVPGKLVLKIGAQVMLLKNINISKGLVNGARGVVVKFENNLPVVKFKTVEYIARHEKWSIKTPGGLVLTRKQIPLKLAWAFSIHKSQGLTLDCVEMSLSRVFESGQAYVALSRAQSLKGLRVLDFDPKQVWADPDVLKFYKKMSVDVELTQYIPLGKRKTDNTNVLRDLVNKLKSSK